MLANSKSGDQAQAGGASFSLRDRLKAWWEGYDLLDLPPASGAEAEPDGDADAAAATAGSEPPDKRWNAARVSLVQKVWGGGFTTPGGRKHTLDMVTSLGLDPAMSVVDLGTGLGGAVRAMSEKFGVWVTGFEADEDLAEAGMALSVKAGMSEKAPVQVFDPTAFEHKPGSVDCIFSKEFLFTVADKNKFLKVLEGLMKPKGQLLFTDFLLAETRLSSPILDTWIENEPQEPRPWSLEDYEVGLTGAKLDIRVAEDITQAFRAMVIKGWADYTGSNLSDGIGAGAAPALVDEVELWTRRIQAIDSGDLKVYRIHAFKKDPGLGMSS